jgi:cytochrome c biogenesis protein
MSDMTDLTDPNDPGDARSEQRELATAERLTTAPSAEPDDSGSGGEGDDVVGIGVVGWLRWGWRQLTSMRTALILLFLLSLAAVPGSLVPQTSASQLNVQNFHTNHKLIAPLFDKLDMFDVYGSFWFSAIYLLLFVSLLGCIIPRTYQFVGVLRAKPPTAPRHLVRLPVYATWRTGADADAVLLAGQALLRKRRFRVSRTGDSVNSEKGYLREVGNLLFHVSLIAMLIAFATTKLFGGMGTVVVIEGNAFSNNVTQYDDFMPSSFYTANSLDPFGFFLNSFDATYQTSGDQMGTARTYAAHISYWTGSNSTKLTKGTIEVNHPLQIDGSNVYLTAHGYAPVIQVTNAKGEVIFDGPTACLPQDADITSLCAFKIADGYVNSAGKSTQIGLTGIFAPTAVIDGTNGPHSSFPALNDPGLFITGYSGDLGLDSGIPQSVYSIDTTHMTQLKLSDGSIWKASLHPEQGIKLPGGGVVTYLGTKQWANFTISHNPGTTAALVSSTLAILGLIGSLFVQRRRIWVRAVTGPDGVTTIEVAGLARSESARIAEELADLALALQDTGPADHDDVADADADAESASDSDDAPLADLTSSSKD